jgi:hypothetical protein
MPSHDYNLHRLADLCKAYTDCDLNYADARADLRDEAVMVAREVVRQADLADAKAVAACGGRR